MADVNAKSVLTAPIFKNNPIALQILGDLFCSSGYHQHERIAGNGASGYFCDGLFEPVRIVDPEPYSVFDPYHCSNDHYCVAGYRG